LDGNHDLGIAVWARRRFADLVTCRGEVLAACWTCKPNKRRWWGRYRRGFRNGDRRIAVWAADCHADLSACRGDVSTALWTRELEKHSQLAATARAGNSTGTLTQPVPNELARLIRDRLSDTNYTHSQSSLLFFFPGNHTNVYQAPHLIFI